MLSQWGKMATCPTLVAALLMRLFGLTHGERQLAFQGIHVVEQNLHGVSDRELAACALAYYLSRIFVEHVAVVGQRVDGNQSFHKKIFQLDKETEARGADDESTEPLTDAILH